MKNSIRCFSTVVTLVFYIGLSNMARAQSGTRSGYSKAQTIHSTTMGRSASQPSLSRSSIGYQSLTNPIAVGLYSQSSFPSSGCSSGNCPLNRQHSTISNQAHVIQHQAMAASTASQAQSVRAPIFNPTSTYTNSAGTIVQPITSAYHFHSSSPAPIYSRYPTTQPVYGSSCH